MATRQAHGTAVWVIRLGVLTAFGLTLWLAGPRAKAVLAHRIGLAGSRVARIDLDRVALRNLPDWLHGDLMVRVMQDLSPRLQGPLALMDDVALARVEARLVDSVWVRAVRLERRLPEHLAVELDLRRPVLLVLSGDDRQQTCLVDGEGICLPLVGDLDLPVVHVPAHGAAASTIGEQHRDPQVVAAAQVCVEWRDEIAAVVEGAPALVEVDASNLGYRYLADGRWSELLVGLRRADGDTAFFGYGHPPGSELPRVESATKASVLRAILAEHPELAGIEGGDLRFANRWRDWLRPRRPSAPR